MTKKNEGTCNNDNCFSTAIEGCVDSECGGEGCVDEEIYPDTVEINCEAEAEIAEEEIESEEI